MKRVYLLLLVVVWTFLPATALAATVTLGATIPTGPATCAPFGGTGNTSWTGFVYQNVPAFSLLPGDIIRFDLGAMNDADIVVDIDMVAAQSNGSDVPLGSYTAILNNKSPVPARGDATANNYELAFTASSGFSFPGGGLIVRVRAQGNYANDTTCNAVLMGASSTDLSAYFVKRFTDADGLPPYTTTSTSNIGQIRFITSDDDLDSIANATDNCPTTSNPGQQNTDGDAQGNACDADDDNDTIADGSDNCPLVVNMGQQNADADAQGDACDTDDDNDAILDASDNCPLDSNAGQLDTDTDGSGDACDTDDDDDGLTDGQEASAGSDPVLADTDADTIGDLDEVGPTATAPYSTDSDGVIDALDDDSDADGLLDEDESGDTDLATPPIDTDSDGSPDFQDVDSDGDLVDDGIDNCVLVANPTQEDSNGNGSGNACDGDADGDTVLDADDNCPNLDNTDQADMDGDGIGDLCDSFDNGGTGGGSGAGGNGAGGDGAGGDGTGGTGSGGGSGGAEDGCGCVVGSSAGEGARGVLLLLGLAALASRRRRRAA